jgi:epoxyqueuosine reductase
MLEEARMLGELHRQGWMPKRTIIYCAWDGEEPGLLGSVEWVEAHVDELKQHAVAYINSDSNERGFFSPGGTQDLQTFISGVARDIQDPETRMSVFQRAHLAGIAKAKDAEERRDLRKRNDLVLDALGDGSDFTAFQDLAGISPVYEFPELARFPEWIAFGRAGEMKYLESRNESGELRRSSLKSAFPWARSVIVCAVNYNTAHPYSTSVSKPRHGWISRYAWSREDYHDSVLRRLRQVETKLKEYCAECRAEEPIETRAYVDTGPLVERVYAKYAGIGWLGKNTCVINQDLGSWLFLGVIVSSLELSPDLPAPDRCGTCTRCIDACPTDAIVAPYELDSNKCISYLTIEKRGPIPEELREGIGHQVFGCDICQDVCPWNRKAPATDKLEFQAREGLVNPALAWLAQISQEEFQEAFRGSPVRRAKRSGLRRNALIAIGNSGDSTLLPVLERTEEDSDPGIANAAKWARSRGSDRDLAKSTNRRIDANTPIPKRRSHRPGIQTTASVRAGCTAKRAAPTQDAMEPNPSRSSASHMRATPRPWSATLVRWKGAGSIPCHWASRMKDAVTAGR